MGAVEDAYMEVDLSFEDYLADTPTYRAQTPATPPTMDSTFPANYFYMAQPSVVLPFPYSAPGGTPTYSATPTTPTVVHHTPAPLGQLLPMFSADTGFPVAQQTPMGFGFPLGNAQAQFLLQGLYNQLLTQIPALVQLAPAGHYPLSPVTPVHHQASTNVSPLAGRGGPSSDLVSVQRASSIPLAADTVNAGGPTESGSSSLDIFAHMMSQDATDTERLSGPLEGPPDAPYFLLLAEILTHFEISQHREKWEHFKKNQLIQFWAGAETLDKHFDLAMSSQTAPHVESKIIQPWHT
ncbi:hypothetical protein FRC10_010824, partial [Ceratobasidium sp. 414]